MPSSTTNFGLLQPLVANPTDEDLWGGYLNQNIGNDDTLLLTAMTNKTVPETANFSVAGRSNGTVTTGNLRNLFLCDCTSEAITASLPEASSVDNGFIAAFKKEDATSNTLTIAPNGSDTIDGADSLVVSAQFDSFVLVSDGVSNWNIMSYKHGVVPKSFSVNVQQFANSGIYTPTAGLAYAIVEMVGGGGGSGGTAVGAGIGGSGGAGYLKALLTAAQIGESQAVTIGAGGTAGNTSGGGSGAGNGGDSTFGSLLEAGGGNSLYAGGGASVSTGIALVVIPGQSGCPGFNNTGGSSGSTPLGMGAPLNVTVSHSAGQQGTGYGSGASGAASADGTPTPGGAGNPGLAIVTEYIFA